MCFSFCESKQKFSLEIFRWSFLGSTENEKKHDPKKKPVCQGKLLQHGYNTTKPYDDKPSGMLYSRMMKRVQC